MKNIEKTEAYLIIIEVLQRLQERVPSLEDIVSEETKNELSKKLLQIIDEMTKEI